jgi:hypothetical protein
MDTWEELQNGNRVELALLQVDIAGNSQLGDNDRILQNAKSRFRRQVEGLTQARGGKLLNWAGDGGSFMFLTGDGEGFDDMAFTAIQILNNLPLINEELKIRSSLSETLSVRISGGHSVVTYHKEASQMTGNFLNNFLKHEREIGLKNTVSITGGVFKQLSNDLRDKFSLFKYSSHVQDELYNYKGKDRQTEVLKSLHNIIESEGHQSPETTPECVEVTAFKGDTLYELSKHAYADVNVTGYENVGGLNLLVTKNSQICTRHWEREQQSQDFEGLSATEEEQLLGIVRRFELDGQELSHIRQYLSRISPERRRGLLRRWAKAGNKYRPSFIDEISHEIDEISHEMDIGFRAMRQREWEPTQEFEGGESIRFYNCTALGYHPIIGKGTLLDHVFAGNLNIARVVGGVVEPVVKNRVFELVDGQYREISSHAEE